MKHSTRKILTLLLALIMLLSMVPLSAYAVGTEGKEQAAARGEAEEISARGTGGVLNASGETKSSAAFGGKKAGSLLLGITGGDRTITATASDGAVVEITGALPKGAEAKIEPVTLTKDELVQYYGADFVEAVDELVVYDICILVDGEEWEPDETVSVVIKSPAIEVRESAEEVAVTHLDDAKKSAEAVETALTEDGDLAFETDSFSLWGLFTYTVDYYLNDNEYHQPGNTSMLLSELFEALACPYPASEVVELTFTDDTLLAIEQLEEDDDWRITSLKPFTSAELLTVTLQDDTVFSIVVEDRPYQPYTYDENLLTPYIGSFAYHGHYDIFGGGNGLPTADFARPDSPFGSWGGRGNWNTKCREPYGSYGQTQTKLNGRAEGEDQDGNLLVGEDNQFKTGSSGLITWNGSVEKAFLSIGYYPRSKYGEMDIKLYAPGTGAARPYTPLHFTLTQKLQNDPRPGTIGDGWHYLTFDATPFVSAYGPGTYSMVVTVTVTPGTTPDPDQPSVSDLGWSIYGVSRSADFPTSAIVGLVDEKRITGSDISPPNKKATAMLVEGVAPKGSGKVWFGVHGGEITNGDLDIDYLKLLLDENGDDYLYFGGGSGVPSNSLPINGVTWNDVAQPNDFQTGAAAGRGNYSNRFAFGLKPFSNLNEPLVFGIQKEMLKGEDVFGSLMLLVEVNPGEGVVMLPKQLLLNNNGFADFDALPEDGTFSFTVTPVDGAPAPSNPTSTVTVPAGSKNGDLATISFGTFTFTEPGTFYYEVTETTSSGGNWTCDSRTLLLTMVVVEDTANNKLGIDSYSWSVKAPDTGPSYFTNEYVVPVRLDVTKTDMTGSAVSGAKFMLYSDASCNTPAAVFIDADMTTALTTANTPATGSNGVASFYGLDKDETYYLKEYSVPSPYILDSTVVTISYDAAEEQWEADGSAMDAQFDDTNEIGILSLTRANNETISVSVTKSWNDSENQDGIRPSSVTMKLLADGTELTDKRHTLTATGANNTWQTADLNSVITGRDGPGTYAYEVTGDAENGFTVTNTHTPEKTTVTVTKVWDDNNSSRRPTSVTITLLADGSEIDSATLTKESGWTHTWTNLDKYKAGRKIVYTVSEKQISGYRKPVISGSAASGFTVTNTMRPPQSPFTGDARAWLPWLGAFLLSGFGLAGDAIVRKRKRKRKEEE